MTGQEGLCLLTCNISFVGRHIYDFARFKTCLQIFCRKMSLFNFGIRLQRKSVDSSPALCAVRNLMSCKMKFAEPFLKAIINIEKQIHFLNLKIVSQLFILLFMYIRAGTPFGPVGGAAAPTHGGLCPRSRKKWIIFLILKSQVSF